MSVPDQEIIIKQNGNNSSFKTEEEEEIGLISWHTFPGGKVLEVHNIYVTVKFQRKGYGTKLFYEMLKKYPSYKSVYLHTIATNIEAIHFYLDIGFERAFKVDDLYGKNQNAIFLVKKI